MKGRNSCFECRDGITAEERITVPRYDTDKLALPSVLSEQEGNSVRARYQKGSLTKIKRKGGYLAGICARDPRRNLEFFPPSLFL